MHREARIWQDALPEACFSSPTTLKTSVSVRPSTNGALLRCQSFCIEYKANLGGRIGYGLLGSTFTTMASDILTVTVPVKSDVWASFSTPIYRIDNVFVGLPAYFANAVLTGSMDYFADHEPITGGNLSFVAAAFSDVGSSPDIFRRLGLASCHYFMLQVNQSRIQDDVDFDELFSLITGDV